MKRSYTDIFLFVISSLLTTHNSMYSIQQSQLSFSNNVGCCGQNTTHRLYSISHTQLFVHSTVKKNTVYFVLQKYSQSFVQI